MSESNKRTERKSQGVRSRHHHNAENEHADQSSRVMDMSWAAKYLDDDWEGRYSKDGGYNTKANAHSQADAVKEAVDLMSQTQEFTPVNSDEPEDELKIRDAVTDRTIVSFDAVSEIRKAVSESEETDLKIRDAATDKTIVSVDAVSEVRNAVFLNDEDDLKIRDAATDKTIVSVDAVSKVRNAAFLNDEDDLKIRDAATDKTIVSVDAVSKVRNAAFLNDEDDLKIRDAATDKTIIAMGPVSEVRRAVSALDKSDPDDKDDDELKIRDAVTDKTIVSVGGAKKVRSSKASKNTAMTAALEEDLADLENIRDARSSKTGKAVKTQKTSSAARKARTSSFSATGILKGIIGNKSEKKNPDISATGILNEVILDEPESYPEEGYDDIPEEIMPADRTAPIRKRRPAGKNKNRIQSRIPEDDDIRIRESRPRSPERNRDRYARYDDYYYVRTKSPLRFIPLVLVIALCVLGFITARVVSHDVPINASDYSKITYTVTEGLTDEVLSRDLRDLGLIDNPLVFRLRCVFYDADYVPGTYELSPCYSTEKIVNILSGYKYGDE